MIAFDIKISSLPQMALLNISFYLKHIQHTAQITHQKPIRYDK
jgi:hypothetical protein